MHMKQILLVVLLIFSWSAAAYSANPPPAPRYLIICMDGVGYELTLELYRQGELRNFYPPVPLISAFPSDSNPSLVEILAPLGAPPARGYEDYYFDPERKRLRGGFFHRWTHKHFVQDTFREFFHYHPSQIRMNLEYALPVLGPWLNGAISLARIKESFLKSNTEVFFAYFDSSDVASHVSGKWLVRRQLHSLDRMVGELRSDPDRRVEVIAFSDHGNAGSRLRRAKLKEALERAGFRLQGKLENQHSVLLPEYGLISSAMLYTQPGQEAAVAEAVRTARGVDLAAYREGESLRIVGSKGTAWIDRRLINGEELFRYRIDTGDPLLLERICAKLTLAGHADTGGFIPQQQWLGATAGHIYPDPLRRLWGGFDGLVAEPASVLVSLEDGYYTGSIWLDLFAFLRTTHGNLRRAQSRGVVLATAPALFLPDRGPFTGENLLARIRQARERPDATGIWEGALPSDWPVHPRYNAISHEAQQQEQP